MSRASLQADLLAAHERAIRLSARIRQLEQRLSDALGEQAWRESGLGTPADIDALGQKITISSSKPPTCGCDWKNVTANSQPREPRTAS